ncbi:MAG: protein kinase, partial [Betaproteobacteria bacterium]
MGDIRSADDAGNAPASDDDATVTWTPAAADPDATRMMPAGTADVDRDATRTMPTGTPAPVRAPVPAHPPAHLPAHAPDEPSGTSAAHAAARRTIAPMVLQPGHRLHEYRIDDVLGQGGFGITYLATDVNLHAQVAIKEYLPAELAVRTGDDTVRPRSIDVMGMLLDGLDQFLVEARTLATFRHPNIVRVARFFEANRTAYMVMDYERGRSLSTWWRKQKRGGAALGRLLGGRTQEAAAADDAPSGIPEPELLMLLAPLLDGLALVHHKGVLHRDIKPDNLSVRDADGSLVLLDFGAARPASGAIPDAPTMLTPGYAPIEQYTDDNQGPWTDLYALGATLYWMVCGKRPRDAPDRRKRPENDVSAEQAGAGRYSPEFLRAIDWALKLRPEDRPQDVAAFRTALFAALAASLGLQEALASSGAGGPEGLAGRARGLRVLGGRVVRPSSWPLALKMIAALVLAAVLPMSITATYNYSASVESLESAERRNIERLALATSGRLSQLIEDSRRMAAHAARGQEVAELLAHPEGDGRAVLAHLRNLVDTNPDLHLLTLMDA